MWVSSYYVVPVLMVPAHYVQTVAGTNDTVRFRNNGLLNNAGGNFRLCDANTADTTSGRNIAINVTGNVTTTTNVPNCP